MDNMCSFYFAKKSNLKRFVIFDFKIDWFRKYAAKMFNKAEHSDMKSIFLCSYPEDLKLMEIRKKGGTIEKRFYLLSKRCTCILFLLLACQVRYFLESTVVLITKRARNKGNLAYFMHNRYGKKRIKNHLTFKKPCLN